MSSFTVQPYTYSEDRSELQNAAFCSRTFTHCEEHQASVHCEDEVRLSVETKCSVKMCTSKSTSSIPFERPSTYLSVLQPQPVQCYHTRFQHCTHSTPFHLFASNLIWPCTSTNNRVWGPLCPSSQEKLSSIHLQPLLPSILCAFLCPYRVQNEVPYELPGLAGNAL